MQNRNTEILQHIAEFFKSPMRITVREFERVVRLAEDSVGKGWLPIAVKPDAIALEKHHIILIIETGKDENEK